LERVNILGIPVDKITRKEALDRLLSFIESRKFHLVVTINSENGTKAIEKKEFLDVIRKADLVVPDGIGIIYASRILGDKLPERVPGIDLTYDLLKVCAKKGFSVVLVGGKEGVADKAKRNLIKEIPNLKILSTFNGYFDKEEEIKIVEEIKREKPDVLLVGMGSEKQELWIYKWREEFKDIPVCIGIGGSLDIWAGEKKRAPKFIQDLGLEWLYRTILEPRRIKRVLKIFKFLFRLVSERWKK